MEILLGSGSPRRREILEFFSLPFRVVSSDFDEMTVPFRGDGAAYALETAEGKAFNLKARFPDRIIVTADTVVYRSGKVYLKPESLEEARGMLKELSGKEHEVYTAVCVLSPSDSFSDVERTRVEFNQLTDSQIEAYQNHFAPLDKAGGYAIQKGGSLIVKRIEGCYYNIMGLPLQTLHRLLLKAGVDLWHYLKSV
jgi:septum formation protein